MKKIFLIIILLVTLQVTAQTSKSVAKKENHNPTMRPKLVLAIVVDQFRYDYLLRFRDDYKEGLHKLLINGAVFTDARYNHFPTFTSVGHSAVLTGAFPSLSGIIGNEWYDRPSGKIVKSISDDSVQQIGGLGGAGSSPRSLLVSTIGDEMKIANPDKTKIFGISLKDYSGILATGHMADCVFWFDGRTGDFVSSTYYVPDLPDWAKEFNAKRVADRYKGQNWLGGKFPTEAGPKLYGSLLSSPAGNELVEEMAEETIKAEKLGEDPFTDLLVLSFSSNDYVGHLYGPDSPQVRDVSINTDKVLGKLFRYIDARVGMANVMVVLTADHGVAPVPEVNVKRNMPGGRVSFSTISDEVQKALTEKFGEGKWILSVPEETIYLNWELIKSKRLTREEVDREAAQAIMAIPHVFRVYTREQLTNGVAVGDQIGCRMMNGFSARRGADINVLLEPYYLFGGLSTTHGTPFGYDTHVPVIFMGPGIKSGSFYASIAVNDIAPTLATILGVETPSGSEGRILSEIFENH